MTNASAVPEQHLLSSVSAGITQESMRFATEVGDWLTRISSVSLALEDLLRATAYDEMKIELDISLPSMGQVIGRGRMLVAARAVRQPTLHLTSDDLWPDAESGSDE